MPRAILCVLDSFGIGGAADAEAFGDAGADTLGHIAARCAAGEGDKDGLRSGPLNVPNMDRLGLGAAGRLSTGKDVPGLDFDGEPVGLWGYAAEVSNGKDTPSGHWEIAGVPVRFDWGYFPETIPTFPEELIAKISEKAGLNGILGDKHASGTVIIAELGEEHIRTGKPIFYTSADSVIQIAAHEEHYGLEKLYELCEIAREFADPYNIGRVIARPFVGETSDTFQRTANRRDYSVLPPEPTLLDRLTEAGRTVYGVGKISDIFAHQGVARVLKGAGNDQLFDKTLEAMDQAADGDLIFANFIDFDSLYGHRRDVPGYAAALEHFDRRLPEMIARMTDGDLLILTADHGCDPTWRGTDHTREHVPVIATGPGLEGRSVGGRKTYADIGESIADHLGIAVGPNGTSFL
ncbi:phosphopentomutase [Roseibium aggregatum]|uniref:Phosphopentomutase n=1 Tax=Roseibium aggregatum TaxID=187304 RepID=A0A0M6Y3F2_9HYPH|nr:phosphopentomutase [Roseibium aggregatum]MCR9281806.1 phosphopentomutase [Paracoccaceae bacterium]UES52782.1 phosphopentomutase [Roseibium aggregatum]CTQ44625.1 Phosphopentomutase [Roseibium aggregatum]